MEEQYIIADILDPDCQSTLHQIQKKNKSKKSQLPKNLLHILLPTTTLGLLPQTKQYTKVQETATFSLYKKDKIAYKMILKPKVGFNKQALTQTILNSSRYPKWNNNITQSQTKHFFPSENLQIIYQKNKSNGTFWKSRDFVYLRHVFSYHGNLYIIDKSITNQSYPPYVTLTRGDYLAIWGLLFNRQEPIVVIKLVMKNQGFLNDQQQNILTQAYIKEFKKICNFAQSQKQQKLPFNLDFNWDITQSEQVRQLQQKTGDDSRWESETNDIETHSEDDDIEQIKYDFNEQRQVIIPQGFINSKYQQNPIESQKILLKSTRGHFVWKDQWKRDQTKGGIIYQDQIRLKGSRNVLNYLLKKMGKNILTGKSILSISLPVNIFSRSSNLEHLALGFSYAPMFLEKAAKQQNFIQQMKLVTLFAIANPVAFITMQKPFNPILGETFQGWINGCPIYLQQVSHHPPIASLYFVGRGYKVSASLESKAQISINSGTGGTDGVYKIIFDDGTDYEFRTQRAQISGMVYGDRKFDFIGKSYVWSNKHQLYLEIIYDPHKKGFFSLSKKATTSDFFVGEVVKVSEKFLKSFQTQENRISPTADQIQQKYFKVQGLWPLQTKIDQKIVFDMNKDLPYRVQAQKNLLPSDCSWRQDVAYRRLRNYDIAQQQKQRLQNKQRHDAKLRKQHKKH